jgi:formylglycine-generating enzyme required for sulfatase activity/plastocyanin
MKKYTVTILFLIFLVISSIFAPPTQAQEKKANHPGQTNLGSVTELENVFSPIYVDVRDHGPDPATVIAIPGQPIIWVNNGAKPHTITRGSSGYAAYFPLVVNGNMASLKQGSLSSRVQSGNAPIFNSGILEPGEQFTYTFTSEGKYNYFSLLDPTKIAGSVIVMESDDRVQQPVQADPGINFTAPGGVGLVIGPGALSTDTEITITTFHPDEVNIDLRSTGGPIYSIELDSPEVIVSPIILSIPYNDDEIPPEINEADLVARYFNGSNWLYVPSTVLSDQNKISVTTSHLSFWERGWLLCKPFHDTFSREDQIAYDTARSFMNALSNHRDLFDILTTSTGKLFQLRAEEANWLSNEHICDLDDLDPQDITSKLGIEASPEEVARAMVSLGYGFQAQEPEIDQIKDMYSQITFLPEFGTKTLKIVDLMNVGWVAGGPAFVADFVVGVANNILMDIYWNIMYAREIYSDAIYQKYFLTHFGNSPVGTSNMLQVNGDEVEGHHPGGPVNPCYYDYGTDQTFFRNSEIYDSFSYMNLYQTSELEGSRVFYVIGLEEITKYYEGPGNPTDRILVLLEYESVKNNLIEKRVEHLVFKPAQIEICPTAKIVLHEIRQGSPVTVTYYFIENGHLSQVFPPKTWSDGTSLCFGECSTDILPAAFVKLNPINIAENQPTDLTLDWGDSSRATSYEYCYDTSNDNACSNWISTGMTSQASINGLDNNSIYSWQVLAKNDYGTTYADGSSNIFWSFTTGVIDPHEIVFVPGGPFQMGYNPITNGIWDYDTPKLTLHTVNIDSFQIDKYEVTNARYSDCVNAGVCSFPHSTTSAFRSSYYGNPVYDNYPVINVDWNQADAYCRWESKRLPSEAEWEKAARGATDTRTYPWGYQPQNCDLANLIDGPAAAYCVGDTTSVGRYPSGASPYGVNDMIGNVNEWVNDWFDENYYSFSPESHPLGPLNGFDKVIRGSSWKGGGYEATVLFRNFHNPSVGWDFSLGFRCAATVGNRSPNVPTNPFPTDVAVHLSQDTNLSWTGEDPDGDAVTYDVYFEADDNSPDVLVSNAQPETIFSLRSLASNTTYYWQVIAQDVHGSNASSPVWSFNTGEGTLMPGEMVLIPLGSSYMGCDPDHNAGYSPCNEDEIPFHNVILSAFRMDKYEVTNAQYGQCVAAGRCASPYSNSSYSRSSYYDNPTFANYPVIYVNWYDASNYCTWAGKRLPSEAEWEKAARGGSDKRTFPWGDQLPDCTFANFLLNSSYCLGDTSQIDANPLGASPYGILDMADNVWEWVNDLYNFYYYYSPSVNPPGPTSGFGRVVRGGSWSQNVYNLRVAYRFYFGPTYQNFNLGFRCASSP